MKSKKLQTLFVVLASAMVLTGVNYTIGNQGQAAYAAEVNETEAAQADSAEKTEAAGKVVVKVTYDNEASTNSINPVITVTNNSDEEINLADLNIKYYYPSNTETNEVFACYYAGTVDGNYKSLTANVEGTLEKCDHIEGSADADADIKFNGGTLDAGQSMTIQISIHKEDWTNYDVTDKSLCCIAAYMDGKLIYEEDKNTQSGVDDTKPGQGENDDKQQSQDNISMSISQEETDYSTEMYSTAVYLDNLDTNKGIASCTAEIKYDPDEVRVVSAEAGKLVDSYKNFKYENDEENGVVKITYNAENPKDCSDLEKAALCYVRFQGLNGEMGSESEVSISGTASSVSDPEKTVDIKNTETGKITFTGDKDVDLSMPVLERNSLEVMLTKEVKIKINENGHEFLGIKGLEEGSDYTFDGKFLTIKDSAVKNFGKDYLHNFYLDFDGEIRKVFTLTYPKVEPSIDYLHYKIKAVETAPGDPVGQLITIDGAELKTQGEFNLTYDPETFKIVNVAVTPEDTHAEANYEIDEENGIIHVSYDNTNGFKGINTTPMSVFLSMKVKNHAKAGDRRIGVENVSGDKNINIHPGELGLIKIKQRNGEMPGVYCEDNHYESNKDITLDISENGNEFLGIEGLEEGKDYTYDGLCNIVLKSDTVRRFWPSTVYTPYYNFYLNFENGIRKTATVNYLPVPDIDSFCIGIGKGQGKQGESIKVPVIVEKTMNDLSISKCSATIKYDTDIFEDAYIEPEVSPYGTVTGICDKENGTIDINYDSLGGDLLPKASNKNLTVMNLVLKVRKDSLIGDTKLTILKDHFNTNSEDKELAEGYMDNYGNSLITITK